MANREIKFRALTNEGNIIYDIGSIEFFVDGLIIVNDEIPVKRLIEFTGLLDKNGKEIFEGDILKCYSYDNEIPKDSFSTWVVGYNTHLTSFCVGTACNLTITLQRDIEVIGNIYENESLLRDGKN